MAVANLKALNDEFRTRAKNQQLTCNVLADGVFKSEIAIIAEAPGAREAQLGKPLVGQSGQLLWSVLQKQGLTRGHCYITNVIKRQLSYTRKSGKSKAAISVHEQAQWEQLLLWELKQLPNLRLVVVCGNVALKALVGETGIMHWRGSVLEVRLPGTDRMITVLCVNNPAAVLHEPKTEIVFRMDMNKLKSLRDGTYKPHNIVAHTSPSFAQANEFLRHTHAEAKRGNPVSFDIETIAGETACIGLSTTAHEGMCINFRDHNSNVFDKAEEKQLRLGLAHLFNDPATKLIAQNGVFDSYWLGFKDRIPVHGVWFDTLLAHHTLYPTLPHGLGFLTAQYTTHPYYKDEKDDWREGGDINSFWEYNVKDACITYACHTKLWNELRDQGLEDFFFSHVMRLQPELVQMTLAGILADRELKSILVEQMEDHVATLLQDFYKRVREATGDKDYRPLPTSPAQMRKLYFHKLKLIGRGTSTNKTNRQLMLDHPRTRPEAKAVIAAHNEYATENKFLTTYAKMRLDLDDRFRCEWRQYGTQSAPGRLSSAQTLWGSGMNMQNQSERSKVMFVADEDYGFGYFDLSQAEARIVGWNYEIDEWKEQFEKARLNPGSYDCHRALASQMWGIPYDDVPTKDFDPETGEKTKRYIAKRCRHGLNYRMQIMRLSETAGLSIREATEAFNIYHRLTPELRQGWERDEREVRTSKTLFNAYGRRLIILEKMTDEALESIVAFYPQSTVGDKVCRVIYQSHSDDNWPDHCRIVLNVHDALIVHGPLDKIKTALSIMLKYAEEPIMVRGEPLIIPAEPKLSYPTVWHVEEKQHEDGTITPEIVVEESDNPRDQHRWSHMKDAEVEKAA